MLVARYYNNNKVQVEEMPVPEISEDEILVKVMASGICGSDVLEWYRIKKAPVVLGHEVSGEIVQVGSKVKKYKKGQRVFVSHHIPCNTCEYCLAGFHTACHTLHTTNFYPGGFAQYLKVPQLNVDRGVFVLPEEISHYEATFIEPLGCVLRGQRLAKVKPQHTLLVLGSGISGILHIALAKATGVAKIIATDISNYRLQQAKKFGADFVFNVQENNLKKEILKINNNKLANVVIVCTGALSAFNQSLNLVDKGGTILFFAAPEPGINLAVPLNDFWKNAITLIPSYGAAPYDLEIALKLLQAKKIQVLEMITHKLSLKEIQKGFNLVAEAKESLKVIIEPQKS